MAEFIFIPENPKHAIPPGCEIRNLPSLPVLYHACLLESTPRHIDRNSDLTLQDQRKGMQTKQKAGEGKRMPSTTLILKIASGFTGFEVQESP